MFSVANDAVEEGRFKREYIEKNIPVIKKMIISATALYKPSAQTAWLGDLIKNNESLN